MGENCCGTKGAEKGQCSEEEMKKKCMMKSIGLLLLRLSMVFFVLAGWMKITNISATAGFLGTIGIPAPELMAWVLAIVELVGGLAVLLGVMTQIFGVLLAFTMLVAIVTVTMKAGAPLFDYTVVYMLVSLALAFTGPGKFSIKAIAKEKCPCGGNCPICKF
jgi:putative oxidoreductase